MLLAIRARGQTGTGQCVDLALYETIFRVLDELAPAFQQAGFVRERMGADTVNVVPHSHYECAGRAVDGHRLHERRDVRPLARRWVSRSWPTPDQYGPKEKRFAARPLVNALVAEWAPPTPRDEVLAACRAGGGARRPLYSIAEIFEDPQYAHHETIVTA